MHILFLDANVLFSAAYRPDAGLRRLWRLSTARQVTSEYALEEARRNLPKAQQRTDLGSLMECVSVVASTASPEHPFFASIALPEKDQPILLAAVAAGATHLITGDVQHFGAYYGQRVGGVLVLPPAEYLRTRGE